MAYFSHKIFINTLHYRLPTYRHSYNFIYVTIRLNVGLYIGIPYTYTIIINNATQ